MLSGFPQFEPAGKERPVQFVALCLGPCWHWHSIRSSQVFSYRREVGITQRFNPLRRLGYCLEPSLGTQVERIKEFAQRKVEFLLAVFHTAGDFAKCFRPVSKPDHGPPFAAPPVLSSPSEEKISSNPNRVFGSSSLPG